jgi:hypothetical protein
MAADLALKEELRRFIRREIQQILSESFGGSPGVYPNAHLIVDRSGRLKGAIGGGEVGFNFEGTADSGGTIGWTAPWPVTFAGAQVHSSGTAVPTYQYAGPGSAFAGTAFPVRMQKGGAIRVIAPTLSGTASYLYVTLYRASPTDGTAI